MAYSEAKVIAGGLAHIPIIIGIFWLIRSYFNKRINNFELAQKPIKVKPPVKKVVDKAKEINKVAVKVSPSLIEDIELINPRSNAILRSISAIPPLILPSGDSLDCHPPNAPQ